MAQNIRAAIISEFQQIASEQQYKLAPLTDDRPLMASGLDSLALAVVVARLEDSFGIDPFNTSDVVQFPVTFGDFVQMYETMHANAAS